MFTGIVQAVGRIQGITQTLQGSQLCISAPRLFLENVDVGASINVDGVCLTSIARDEDSLRFDAIHHTLESTTLCDRVVGDAVNLERSLRFGEEIGGHVVSGHVSTRGTIVEICTNAERNSIEIALGEPWSRYVFDKGFIAIDGVSLTVSGLSGPDRFQVALIPETLRATAFNTYRAGEAVNIEVESQTKVLVDVLSCVLSRGLQFPLHQAGTQS